jgi:hypothetical protein
MGAADDCKRHQESAAVGDGHLNITVHSFRPPKNHKNRPKRSHNYNILIDYIILIEPKYTAVHHILIVQLSSY